MRRLVVVALLLGACKGKEAAETKPPSAPASEASDVDLPQVVGGGTVPLDPRIPVLSASTKVITLEGEPLVVLRDGEVDPAEKEGGASGRKLTRVNAALAARAQAQPPAGEVLGLAIDRRLTYGLAFDLIYSAKSPPAGWKRFAVLVRVKDKTAALPLTLPDRRRPATNVAGLGRDLASQVVAIDEEDLAAEPPLSLVLSISSEELRVWSLSRQEGSLGEPRLRVPRADPTALKQIGDVLAEIVKRRWAGKQRGEDTREIILMASSETPMQLIAEAIAAVRATPSGDTLFPDVVFSQGFEGSADRAPPTGAADPPAGRLALSDKATFDDTSLTPDIVLAKIQSAYFAGLKRCYKTFLAKDPAARGKITLSFTVDESGRTRAGTSKGFSPEVDDCITGLMKSWVFPIPKDVDGNVTDATFSLALQLTPD